MDTLLPNAILFGLLISVSIGPVFFLLIEVSVKHNYKSALQVSIGAITSDILYIIISYFFVTGVLTIQLEENVVKLIGGIIFILLGIVYLLKQSIKKRISTTRSYSANYFIKSFIINSINPSVLFFWIAAVSYGSVLFPNNTRFFIYYIAIVLCTAFLMDVVKIYLSKQVKEILHPSVLAKLNVLTGIALLLFGIFYIYFF